MMEKRKQIRYSTQARARVPEVFEGDVLLKDISVTGCGIESTMFMDINLNHRYKIEVLPEEASKIGPFELMAEVLWIRTGGYSFEAGLTIVESPKGKQFQRYVDYLSWR
ncbi:MAG: PilZ domain-containing protein [Spirochaetaceae bacterium]|nr:PilZ domain-containing protein [Spirochaetaceae bacterium]